MTAGPDGIGPGALYSGSPAFAAGAVVERYEYGDFGLPRMLDAGGSPRGPWSAFWNSRLFTGREWEPEIEFYYYRTRYLEPTWGRFATRDTIGIWGDPANSGNALALTSSSPLDGVDPFGQLSWDDFIPVWRTIKHAWNRHYDLVPGTNWADYGSCRPSRAACRLDCNLAVDACQSCVDRQAIGHVGGAATGGALGVVEALGGGGLILIIRGVGGLATGGILAIDGLIDLGMTIADGLEISKAAKEAKRRICRCS